MSPKDEAAKTVERMKTETIHAQAMQLEYMRRRLDEVEQQNKTLEAEARTLRLKLSSANRMLDKLQGGTA